jgi:hypothetical protein
VPPTPRKKQLIPHTDAILNWLARFVSHEEICSELMALGVEAKPQDIKPFTVGKYRALIVKMSDEIAEALPISSPAFCIMELDRLVRGASSPAEKLSAIRIRCSLMKKDAKALTPEELLNGDDE